MTTHALGSVLPDHMASRSNVHLRSERNAVSGAPSSNKHVELQEVVVTNEKNVHLDLSGITSHSVEPSRNCAFPAHLELPKQFGRKRSYSKPQPMCKVDDQSPVCMDDDRTSEAEQDHGSSGTTDKLTIGGNANQNDVLFATNADVAEPGSSGTSYNSVETSIPPRRTFPSASHLQTLHTLRQKIGIVPKNKRDSHSPALKSTHHRHLHNVSPPGETQAIASAVSLAHDSSHSPALNVLPPESPQHPSLRPPRETKNATSERSLISEHAHNAGVARSHTKTEQLRQLTAVRSTLLSVGPPVLADDYPFPHDTAISGTAAVRHLLRISASTSSPNHPQNEAPTSNAVCSSTRPPDSLIHLESSSIDDRSCASKSEKSEYTGSMVSSVSNDTFQPDSSASALHLEHLPWQEKTIKPVARVLGLLAPLSLQPLRKSSAADEALALPPPPPFDEEDAKLAKRREEKAVIRAARRQSSSGLSSL